MIPIVLDPAHVRIGLVGRGDRANRRLAQLREAGAEVTVFAAAPADPCAIVVDGTVAPRTPEDAELDDLHVLWVVDLPREEALALAERARARRVLVNVEDVTQACDFHNVAQVRRGDLLLTVSTGGKSPAVAAHIRRVLSDAFGADWASWLDQIGAERARARDAGASAGEVTRLTEALLARRARQ